MSHISARKIDDKSVAVRYNPAMKLRIRTGLVALGTVRNLAPLCLFVVEFPDHASRERAGKKLKQWEQDGSIDFVTPLLRDPDSDDIQILTDEITVRFKPDMARRYLTEFGQKYDLTVARQNEFVPDQYILKVAHPDGTQTIRVAEELANEVGIEFAAPNLISTYRR